jgi:hypothetical protein
MISCLHLVARGVSGDPGAGRYLRAGYLGNSDIDSNAYQ